MDDLYDNLENYNDVNIVDELKSENKELKLKLEEYSKAMAQLQKDFDKVNTEYKKLEINYSSLLKTARAEIERKTEIIKTLNMEKDMFIINSLKKTGKNVTRNFACSKVQVKNNDKSTDSTVNIDKQNTAGPPAESKNEKYNRIGFNQTPSIDSLSTISTDNKSTCSDEKVPKSIDSYEKNKNRENFSRTSRKDESLQSCKIDIVNRRKSMPMTSNLEEKFSTDEDFEGRNVDNLRKSPPRNDTYYEWHENRDYRTTEPYEYYDSSREPYRSRTSKYIGHEKYRNIDKHDHFQKHRRNYSPDRNQYRYMKEQTENHQFREDYGKQRVLRSPPSDKYHHSKSRDRRFNVERDNYRDYDKHSSRYGEPSTLKHKVRREFDEPSSKRLKTVSYNKCTPEAKTCTYEKEREIAERLHSKPQDYKQISSCQSPDYEHVDNIPQHFIKEIRSTAITNLEDPRISSKKYFLKTANDNTVLKTVASRMIDMKCVNKSAWGINKINIPKALLKCPSEQDNDILKEIYMDIDKPVLNASLESGEIQNFDDDLAALYSREVNRDNENEKNGESKSSDNQNVLDTIGKIANSKTLEKSVSTKFKIPKIKKPDKTDIEKKSDNCDTHDTLKKSLTDSKDSNVSVESNQGTGKIEENISKFSIGSNVSKNNVENSDINRSIIDKRKQSIISTIEGDLELSDEASDVVEIHKDVDKKSTTQQSSESLNNDKSVTDSASFNENNPVVSSLKMEKTNTKENNRNKSSTKKNSTKDSSKESSKKRKNKRKSLEQKETNCTNLKQKSEELHDVKKLKEKESISKQTINKFSDLFGDSSSLITLDDLGLNNVQVQPVNKFTSIFDNTQDAVDMSVEDISNTITTKKANSFDTILDDLNDKNDADKTKHFSVNVTVVKENGDNNAENKNASLNVYENTKSETLTSDAPEVVKTVIISTGKQPECISDFTSNGTSNINEPSATTIPEGASIKKCLLGNIEALATSTPQKFNDHVPVPKDSVCPNTNMSTEETNISSCSNANNTGELQNDADIPDVRIIVRRKRKVIKKAT